MVCFLPWAWQHENVRSGAPQSICGHEGNASTGEMEPEKEERKIESSGYYLSRWNV